MARSRAYSIGSILAQIVIVSLAIAACSYLSIYYYYQPSLLNNVWLFGVPIGLAICANRGLWLRVVMGLVLVACALLVFAEMIVVTGCC